MEKHAYLLMIHTNNEQLHQLLYCLDNPQNDIYIHVDKKCKHFNKKSILDQIQEAKLFFIKRSKCYWDGYSMVNIELALLSAATKSYHSYYHLLSGNDLPLVSQKQIQDFFSKCGNKEFVHFGPPEFQKAIQTRYSVYHFFQRHIREIQMSPKWNMYETYCLAIQRHMKINRKKSKHNIFGGANWFSITHKFAIYVTHQRSKIHRQFAFSQNPDEMFLQTILMDSPFKDNIYYNPKCYSSNLRYTDWTHGKNGGPGILTINDYNKIIDSQCLFARKFDCSYDKEIVKKIIMQNERK